MNDNEGCWVWAALLAIGGGFWAYNHYSKAETTITPPPPPPEVVGTPARHSGMIEVSSTDDGSIWYVDADTVRGSRKSRQGWVTIDASKNKTVTWRKWMTLYRVDCETTASESLTDISYNAKGEVITRTSVKPEDVETLYYPPGTIAGAAVKELCDYGYGL